MLSKESWWFLILVQVYWVLCWEKWVINQTLICPPRVYGQNSFCYSLKGHTSYPKQPHLWKSSFRSIERKSLDRCSNQFKKHLLSNKMLSLSSLQAILTRDQLSFSECGHVLISKAMWTTGVDLLRFGHTVDWRVLTPPSLLHMSVFMPRSLRPCPYPWHCCFILPLPLPRVSHVNLSFQLSGWFSSAQQFSYCLSQRIFLNISN